MNTKNPKFKIVTLGCRTNQYESQAYADQLKSMGYTAADDSEPADLCIVNTCTVTDSADHQSRYEIRQLARQHPGARLVVTGCAAERKPDEIKALAGVTDIVANADKEFLMAALFPEEQVPEFAINFFDAHTRAFVKVQDGCNSFCTYCIIPYVRGRSRSRTVAEVVAEVERLVANGYREVVLTGINIGDFDGAGEKATLADLVRSVDQVEGLERLRVSSIDPDEVSEDLLDAIVNGRNTCHSMHIVLQAGSNVTLKRMNRKYTRQVFMETVDRLKAAAADFTFTTDVIVGFPGETDADFNDTIDVIRDVKFAKVHMFPYSERARTRAALMPNKVPGEVIRRRKQELLRLAEQVAYELHGQFVGQQMTILTESSDSSHPGYICGHTDNFLKVWIPDDGIGSNQLVEVILEENTPTGLKGRKVCR
jgi:threonylcarbamoyladenosine tRNA methylthiotransferase MtaB